MEWKEKIEDILPKSIEPAKFKLFFYFYSCFLNLISNSSGKSFLDIKEAEEIVNHYLITNKGKNQSLERAIISTLKAGFEFIQDPNNYDEIKKHLGDVKEYYRDAYGDINRFTHLSEEILDDIKNKNSSNVNILIKLLEAMRLA